MAGKIGYGVRTRLQISQGTGKWPAAHSFAIDRSWSKDFSGEAAVRLLTKSRAGILGLGLTRAEGGRGAGWGGVATG